MNEHSAFFNPYTHGFARVAAGVPRQHLCQPRRNAEDTIALARLAADRGAVCIVFPELGLTGYTADDLFHQTTLLREAERALETVLRASLTIDTIIAVGLPLRREGAVWNCAALCWHGEVLCIVPKTYLPTYREFYEKRYFASATQATFSSVTVAGATVPFGTDIIVDVPAIADFRLHAEICEDLWAPVPPSTHAALAGATVLLNLSASNITIAKADYRRLLGAGQSSRCLAAYVYAGAGEGESTTDMAWDGHAMIWENGRMHAESRRFARDEQLICADIDLEMLVNERIRMSSFTDAAAASEVPMRTVQVPAMQRPRLASLPLRGVARFPYVPADSDSLDERCFEAYNIQVQALATRLETSGIQRIIIGISGGLDSTHALLVAVRAMERIGLPRTNIHAYTMPGFATSDRTRKNAHALMASLGVTAGEIDIRDACQAVLKDLGHPAYDGSPVYDVTYENVQAGERTSRLFRLANHLRGLVLGTGDLSELALGWATYGVGDHMSHYAVNASVPKTLIRRLIRWVADTGEVSGESADVLRQILATEISPELVPASGGDGGNEGEQPSQRTEQFIGPYELQDFNLYYTSRYGFAPAKTAYLSYAAWHDRDYGHWPSDLSGVERHQYSLGEIKHWLSVFMKRFFGMSQFKRSCIPNGPKVGSGGSLSPRSDWRAPSDVSATLWLEELEKSIPDELPMELPKAET